MLPGRFMNNSEDAIFKAYLKLREKLLKINDGTGKADNAQKFAAVDDLSKSKSTNHHYIPKYFTDGFLDDDGLLFVYDKQKDRIKLNKQGSKGVFFAINRNSSDFGLEKPISIMEDAYGVFDNIAPAAIKLLRSNIQLSDNTRIDLHAHLNTLIIDLYWRNINNDQLFDSLYDRASLTLSGVLGSVKLSDEQARPYKDFPLFKQLIRYKMAILTLEFATKSQNIFTSDIITFPIKHLCIGDMPFLFNGSPKKHSDLLDLPAFIPISATKLYLRNITLKRQMSFRETNMLNALIIEQSSKMICSGNKLVMDAAIDYYRLAKEENLFEHFKNCLFNY